MGIPENLCISEKWTHYETGLTKDSKNSTNWDTYYGPKHCCSNSHDDVPQVA